MNLKRVAELVMWLTIFLTVIVFGVGIMVPDKFDMKSMIPPLTATAVTVIFYLVTSFLEKRNEKRKNQDT